MRAKKAKQLRKFARDVTVGNPEREYYEHVPSGQVRLKPTCTRGTYRAMKRAYKKAKRA